MSSVILRPAFLRAEGPMQLACAAIGLGSAVISRAKTDRAP